MNKKSMSLSAIAMSLLIKASIASPIFCPEQVYVHCKSQTHACKLVSAKPEHFDVAIDNNDPHAGFLSLKFANAQILDLDAVCEYQSDKSPVKVEFSNKDNDTLVADTSYIGNLWQQGGSCKGLTGQCPFKLI